MIDVLIEALKATEDKNAQAVLLETYIAQYGPVPDEYGDIIKELLRGGTKCKTQK